MFTDVEVYEIPHRAGQEPVYQIPQRPGRYEPQGRCCECFPGCGASEKVEYDRGYRHECETDEYLVVALEEPERSARIALACEAQDPRDDIERAARVAQALEHGKLADLVRTDPEEDYEGE